MDDEAKKRQTAGLIPFQPGQSGNPGGRPAIPEDVKKLRKLTNEQIKEVGSLLLEGREADLEQMAADPETSMLKKWMAKIALRGCKSGDVMAFNALADRIAGKVKDHVVIELPKPTIIERNDGSHVELGAIVDRGDHET